jgi:hypothetical protein
MSEINWYTFAGSGGRRYEQCKGVKTIPQLLRQSCHALEELFANSKLSGSSLIVYKFKLGEKKRQ